MIVTIIIFLVMLAVLVFVHELGHFAFAKWVGARVDEFAIGFPPRVFSKKVGETVYAINAVPFGGYVKILGEDAEEDDGDGIAKGANAADSERSLARKSRGAQIVVMAAGITANVIFAAILLSLAFFIGMPASSDNYFNAPVSNPRISIVSVVDNSPASKAGLAAGDAIVAVSGVGAQSLAAGSLTVASIRQAIQSATGSIAISYVSDKDYSTVIDPSKIKTADVTPVSGIADGHQGIGIGMDDVGIIRLSAGKALVTGIKGTFYMVVNTFDGLASFFAGFFQGHYSLKASLSEVSGPVGIAKMVGDARSFGFAYLLSFTALISINLAIINALPLPALDGGRIAILIIEAVIRRPLNPRAVNLTHTIGFAALIILMLVITANDILKLF